MPVARGPGFEGGHTDALRPPPIAEPRTGSAATKEIELEIGTLAGIEFEALDFALKASLKTPLTENSNIQIHKIQAKSICQDCMNEFETLNLFEDCPKCKSYNTKLIKGKELQVKSLLID